MEIGVYIGTYTPTPGFGSGEGIYYFSLDKEGKVKTPIKLALKAQGPIVNPSYLIVSKDRQYLFGVNEVQKGSVTGYRIQKNHQLKPLNAQLTNLSSPVYLAFDKSEKHLFVANYGDGTSNITSGVTVFSLESLKNLPPLSQLIPYLSVPDVSHAHGLAIKNIQGTEYLFVTDLGTNYLHCYVVNSNCQQPLTLFASAQGTKGQGPRHIAVSSDGKYIYVINEFDPAYSQMSSISIFRFNSKASENSLEYVKSVAAEQSMGSTVQNYPAGIVIHKDDLYVSNRGDDNIAHFKIVAKGADLKYVCQYSLPGYNWPREFAITPNGKFLVAAYQKSNNIAIFKIQKDGSLTLVPQSKPIQINTPVAIAFV